MKTEGLYDGEVVHARVRPKQHKLAYRVFSLLTDIDQLPTLDRRLRLFSHNRFNLFSLYDRDHGQADDDLRAHLDRLAVTASPGIKIARYIMLCYPRVLGYAFNPLTVFYGCDATGRIVLTIYEVNNTFGERQAYALPVLPRADGLISQSCDKTFYVSPFNAVEGKYLFHVTPPGDALTVGVALKDQGGALLRAHFRGAYKPLTDKSLLKAFFKFGWFTLKVIAGIHYEALLLWLKGIKLVPKPESPEKRAGARLRSRQSAGTSGQ